MKAEIDMVVKMRAIIPAKLKLGPVRLEALNAMRKMGTPIRRDFARTTETWKHKPKFEQSVSLKPPGPTLTVWTENEIYGYVNDGTRGRFIEAKNVPYLVFKGTFIPKTLPGALSSVPGGSFPPWVSKKKIWNPGIKPRKFDETIKKKWQPIFVTRMTAAIKQAVKASGHAI